MAGNTLRIKLVRSTIGCVPAHRKTVAALGLRRLGAVVEKAATPAVLGMVRTVSYLLDVKEMRGVPRGEEMRDKMPRSTAAAVPRGEEMRGVPRREEIK